eukprot:Selendium_serpulae@DN4468_c0_g1_i2.p1
MTSASPDSGAKKGADKIMRKFPNRVPVICEKDVRSTSLPTIPTKKFLVPRTMLVGEFKYIIFRHITAIDQTSEKSIYLFVNEGPGQTRTRRTRRSPAHDETMGEIWNNNRDTRDGFLYMEYSAESTLGSTADDE